jgi:hypothetical protein
VPGAVYNVALVTVRNGTSQTITSASGFSVRTVGGSGSQPFPMRNTSWKPGQVFIFYTFTRSTFGPDFAFDFNGSRPAAVPSSIFYNIQYSPSTFPGVLNSLVTTRLVGSRYQLVAGLGRG